MLGTTGKNPHIYRRFCSARFACDCISCGEFVRETAERWMATCMTESLRCFKRNTQTWMLSETLRNAAYTVPPSTLPSTCFDFQSIRKRWSAGAQNFLRCSSVEPGYTPPPSPFFHTHTHTHFDVRQLAADAVIKAFPPNVCGYVLCEGVGPECLRRRHTQLPSAPPSPKL